MLSFIQLAAELSKNFRAQTAVMSYIAKIL